MYPWTERNGQLSWLKLPFFVLTLAPGFWIAWQWQFELLGPKPVTEAIHQTGDWVIHFLMLSLAITPLRFTGRWIKLVNVRRMLGVAAMTYAIIHLLLYVILDQKFDLVMVASEIVLRFYLTIGFIALLGLAALGATSTDAMISRLGATKWNRLHALVYPIAALGLVHFYIQSKLNVYEPVLMTGVFALLMFYRLLRKLAWPTNVFTLAGIGIAAAVTTALVEALWYWLMRGVPMERVLWSHLNFAYEIRPAWWVLLAGVVLPLLSLVRKQPAPRVRAASSPRQAAQMTDA